MAVEEFIGESEATKIAGVSSGTLRRFSEAGYLRPEVDGDGLKLYSKKEIASLFRIEIPEIAKVIPMPRMMATPSPSSMSAPEELSGIASDEAVTTPLANGMYEGNAVRAPLYTEETAPAGRSTSVPAELIQENERLKHILSLNDQLLEQFEKRIADLTKERDWLRKQIEQLNEQLSRDQVLMLTQTQAIAQVMSRDYAKPGLMTRIFGLLGFDETKSKPTSNNS